MSLRARPGRTTPLVLALLLPACGDAGPRDPDSVPVAASDSAGVRIVVNGGAPDSAALSFDTEVEIGVTGGDPRYEFDDIGAVAVASDGTIFAANRGDASVRAFKPEREFVRQFGGRGEGPGEFRSIDGMWIHGDTLAAVDRWNPRAAVFGLDGTLVDTWDLRVPDVARVDIAGLTDAGVLAWTRISALRFGSDLRLFSLFRDTLELRRYDPAGPSLGPVLVRRATERGLVGAEVYPSGPLFEPLTVTAVAPDGRLSMATDGRYAVDIYNSTGALIRRITRAVPPAPITPDHVDALMERTGTTGERGGAVARAADHPMAPAFARIGAILAAHDGSLLLLRMDEMDPVALEMAAGLVASRRPEAVMARSAARWDLIDPDGPYLGAVRLPAGFQPRWFDGMQVIGVREDELGVQRLVVGRLDSRGRCRPRPADVRSAASRGRRRPR